MPKKTYIFMLTDNDRKRHEHQSYKGSVSEFVVQYETFLEGRWVPIVRYDNAHGFAHKDLLNPDGSKEKIIIGNADLNEALISADKDTYGG